MDTEDDGGKKTSKESNLFKEEPGPSSKRWMRSDAKKSSDKGEICGTSKMNNFNCGETVEIDIGKGKKRKLSSMEETPSKRRQRSESKKRMDENLELPIFKLPMELWEAIFDMVPISQWASMESISHRFQDVVHQMWGQLREIRLDELVFNKKKPYQVVEAVLEKFLIRVPTVASISGFDGFFNRSSPIRPRTIRLLSKFEHLKTVDFSGRKMISMGNFATFLESTASWQSYKRLDIVGGIFEEPKSNNAIVSKENRTALNLEFFKFSMERFNFFDRYLPIEWSGLKELVIVGSNVHAKEILLIIRQCTQITHLEIRIPQCGKGNGQPSFAIFMQAIADLENLSVLKIDGSISGLIDFHNSLPFMIQNLAGRNITELALVPFYCTSQIVDAIIDNLKLLKSLDLDMTNCSTASLLRLANEMGQLESLKFRSRSINPSIDSSVLRAIGGNLFELRYLYFDLRNGVCKDFAGLGNLRKLKELRFTGNFKECANVGIWTRLEFGECMESLELSFKAGVRSEAVVKFFKNMPRLRRLRLGGAIGRKGFLSAIAKSCPKLVELHLGYWPTVTAKAIQSIINSCSQLEILKLGGRYDWFPDALKVEKDRKITFNTQFDE